MHRGREARLITAHVTSEPILILSSSRKKPASVNAAPIYAGSMNFSNPPKPAITMQKIAGAAKHILHLGEISFFESLTGMMSSSESTASTAIRVISKVSICYFILSRQSISSYLKNVYPMKKNSADAMTEIIMVAAINVGATAASKVIHVLSRP